MIMARLQRVVFVALHQYLGLTSELIREIPEATEWVNCGEDPDGVAQDGLASRDVMMNVAVRAFQQELNLNNLDYLRERYAMHDPGRFGRSNMHNVPCDCNSRQI